MKIQADKVYNFIKTLKNEVRGVLIFGPDEGLVSIRKTDVLEKVLPDYKNSLSLITINNTILKEQPEIIKNEYNSTSLFGGDKKVILIEGAENNLSKILNDIFSTPQNNNDNFFIITAGDLDSKSTLRKFADNNQYFASLPCYKDDINSIKQIINFKLGKNNFKYDADVVNYLANSFGGNRLIILSELDKLIIYKDTDKNLTIDDVKLCIQDNSEGNINDFINNLALLDINKSYKELQNLYSEGVFPVAIIRMAISYFIKLQLYKYRIETGMSFEELASKENIFWKQRPITKQHLYKLSLKNINDILLILLKIECKLKGKENNY